MSDETTDAAAGTATDLIADLRTADAEKAQAIWDAEAAKPEEKQRSTVLGAAEARLAELEPIIEAEATTGAEANVLDAIPDGAWGQLLDGDGEPVLVDGKPVESELVP